MLDLNGFFALCAVAVIGLTVIVCFCIYYGVTFKRGSEIIEVITGRKDKVPEKIIIEDRPLEEEDTPDLIDVKKDNIKNKYK